MSEDLNNASKQFAEIFITPKGICELLGVSRSTVTYYETTGVIPPSGVIDGSNTKIWLRAEISEKLVKLRDLQDNNKKLREQLNG